MSKENLTATQLQRYEELKSTGFVNLKGEERTEYSQLKELYEAQGEEQPKNDDNTIIKLTKADLRALVTELTNEQLKEFQNEKGGLERKIFGNKWLEWTPEVQQNKTATFRLYQEDSEKEVGLIVDRWFFKNVFNEETRKTDKPIYKITLLYADGKTAEAEISLEELAKIENWEKVEVIEWNRKKVFKDFGEVLVTKQDKDGTYLYSHPTGSSSMIAQKTAESVPLRVFRDVGTCKCKRQSGQIFEVSIDRLNGS